MFLYQSMIKGFAYQDDKTKRLVERIPKKSIAVIVHQDIDMVAAQKLIQCEVKAVVNYRKSMSGMFLHHGVETLLQANIPVFDIEEGLKINLDDRQILIKDKSLYMRLKNRWQKLCNVKKYTFLDVEKLKETAKLQFPVQFKAFVGNSLYYGEKELDLFVREVLELSTMRQFLGKDVLIVARGTHYDKDLAALKPMIKQRKMITIAVDGGADGLLEIGIKPDYIIGDMDSVSKKALIGGGELIVHSYPDGRAPGEARVAGLKLPYNKLAFLGTSEDVAIIFSYCAGAKHIYTIGTRVGMNEFLEKGRIGMGSSLLTRMKVGHALVDLKGIHTIIEKSRHRFETGFLFLPAIILLLLISIHPKFELLASLVIRWWLGG